ncbi:MAG: hypothetical protein RID91_13100 [Azospirillaceae bacterium]
MRYCHLAGAAVIVSAMLLTIPPAEAACGVPADPCALDDGEYFAALPDAPEDAPWVVWLHGYGGSATADLGREARVGPMLARGYAVIAPQALPFQPGEPAEWSLRDEWDRYPRDWDYPRDDLAFLEAVIDDAATRFGLDRRRGVVAGFSTGGSMVWDLACLEPDTAAAYAPVAGGFWETMPETCAGPVRLFHTHGFTDTVVPLEGREIALEPYGRIRQADIHAGLAVWRETMGCGTDADSHEIAGELWHKAWTDCAAGSLDFALHPGGHTVPDGWAETMLDWFEGVARSDP